MSDETTVLTPEFRASYPAVFKPRKNDLNGKDEFDIVMLFPKDADLSGLKAAAKAAIKKKWGDKPPAGLRSPFRDQGEKQAKSGDGLAAGHVEGAIFIRAKSTMAPGVVGPRKDPATGKLEELDERSFYAGCYARAKVNAYAYDNKGNKGVAFGLRNVQKLRDGESLGGGFSRPEDDFDAVETGDGPAEGSSTDDIFN